MSSCYVLLLHREKEQRKEKQKTQTGRKETFKYALGVDKNNLI